MSKKKHSQQVLDEVDELRRLALQGKLSIPGSDYVKERQKWADEPFENILASENEINKRNNYEF